MRDLEGSQDEKAAFDLLSELVKVPAQEIDPSRTYFDANGHIGLEFLRKNPQGVPSKTKVMEVDDETGKVLLEYVNGGLEWVEPNIIQEALLSKDQGDGDFYTFDKILNHRTLPGGKIEIEVLWDNGEVSWEPLAAMRKDDPVTIAG